MSDATVAKAEVTDHRTPPRGVLPRHLQMWLMVGLAVAILGIIAFAGHPEPAPPTSVATQMEAQTPSPDRLRDYQDRLRVLDARTRQAAVEAQTPPPASRPVFEDAGGGAGNPDPLESERRRREYESLFASNMVMSRRPEAQRFVAERPSAVDGAARSREEGMPAPPSLDEVADAVVRATTKYVAPPTTAPTAASPDAPSVATRTAVPGATAASPRPASTGPISSAGPVHRILEGTVIDTVLTNRLDGSAAAPVNCLVTSPIYSHDGRVVVIPAGSRVLGETKPVQSFGETRLAVAFNRLVLPDGRTYRLEQFMGLNEIGEAGLRDQVNQHYRSTFGASAAVGLLTGFAQSLSSWGFNRNGGTVVIAGNVGDSTAQATAQTMNRFLNRLPTVTVREGHRVKVYLTNDLELPAYDVGSRAAPGSMLAQVR
jgi:type IV secretion system protein TrbI